MTFDEASKALLELASGEYCSIEKHFNNNDGKTTYSVYIASRPLVEDRRSWKEAIDIMRKHVKADKKYGYNFK